MNAPAASYFRTVITLAGLLWGSAGVFASDALAPVVMPTVSPPAVEAGVTAPAASSIAEASSSEAADRLIVINVLTRQLSLYEGARLVKTFPVGLGRANFRTPVGRFKIIRKVLHPAWENPYAADKPMVIRPGARNPLGTRWMGFLADARGEYGIHGTDRPASVGKYSSHGCVRMRIPDAEFLYAAVREGTPVLIRNNPVVIEQDGLLVTMRAFSDAPVAMPTADQVQARASRRFPDARIDPLLIARALQAPSPLPQIIGYTPAASPAAAIENPVDAKTP